MSRPAVRLAALAALLAALGCAAARGGPWDAAEIERVTFQAGPERTRWDLADRAAVAELAACVNRAAPLPDEAARTFRPTATFHVRARGPAEGIWQVAGGTGRFTRLAMNRTVVYQLDAPCQAAFARWLEAPAAGR